MLRYKVRLYDWDTGAEISGRQFGFRNKTDAVIYAKSQEPFYNVIVLDLMERVSEVSHSHCIVYSSLKS